MKASEVYLKAAELLGNGDEFSEYSCVCIARAADKYEQWGDDDKSVAVVNEYVEMFTDGERDIQYQFMDCGAEQDNVRLLALLFMSHIARDEERRKA